MHDQKLRGRPRSDPSAVLRARLWAQVVYLSKPDTTWETLDDSYVWDKEISGKERPRTFHRIFRLGHDPTNTFITKNGIRRRSDLVKMLSRQNEYRAATSVYNSKFWRLVTPPALTIEECEALNQELLAACGFCQVDEWVGETGKYFYPKNPAFKLGDQKLIRKGARQVASMGTLEAIGLLCLQMQMAVDRLAFDEAKIFLNAAYSAIRLVNRKYQLKDDIRGDLYVLIEKRLFRSDWTPIAPIAMSTHPYTRMVHLPRKPNYDSAKDWEQYFLVCASERRFALIVADRKVWPITPLSPRLADLISNHAEFRNRKIDEEMQEIMRDQSPEKRESFIKYLLSLNTDEKIPFAAWHRLG